MTEPYLKSFRPTINCVNGAVSSGHHLASVAGLKILMHGGNAFDAAIATSATLSVVTPQMCGIGGDGFGLLRDKSGELIALNSGGRAPRDASVEKFLELGFDIIPETGILSVGVPGLLKAWKVIQERYCTMGLEELLNDAIYYAKNGFPVYKNLAKHISMSKQKLTYPGSLQSYFANRVPIYGDRIYQENLGHTLKSLISDGIDSFYQGRIAKEMANFCKRNGGWLTLEDLEAYDSEILKPISIKYRDACVYEQPPMSQGFLVLEMLNIIEAYNPQESDLAEMIHLMVEAKKFAFHDRMTFFGDPEFIGLPLDELLSKQHASEVRSKIDKEVATKHMADSNRVSEGGDTTSFCIADSQGNCVSFIQSIFTTFGSGVIAGNTGVLMNDRMMSFSLKRGHPNCLEPYKRPAHTLNTFIVSDESGNPRLIGGTPGADDQVQTNLQVLVSILDLGLDVQEAIEVPRWSSKPGTLPRNEDDPYELHLESRFSHDVFALLSKKGHDVRFVEPWSIGGLQIIQLDSANRIISAGADPRRDGYAVGF